MTGKYGREHFEDIAADIVVVHHVDEVIRIAHLRQDAARGRIRVVVLGPDVGPHRERFVLPCKKRSRIHDGRLDNLRIWKHAPGNGIGARRLDISTQRCIWRRLNRVDGKRRMRETFAEQYVDNFSRCEKLKVCFLIHEATLGAPSMCRVARSHAIDAWLRVDGEDPAFVEPLERGNDACALGIESVRLCPRQPAYLASHKTHKHVNDVTNAGRLAPHFNVGGFHFGRDPT
mmetsp:Transcript_7178/g.19236  ORF Transcript_7178/g.19236 Transcript_7178/m.19236 type:complete len:231 (-) Transcript_7178:178-870(-)